ncbi:MAG: hypothetical protein K6E19_05470 [Lachnospiraceae bacterium]|nr:hypothetical protein [Lachnospiraceae bacterium]
MSNLYKSSFVRFSPENTKVINSDEIVKKRLEMNSGVLRELEPGEDPGSFAGAEGEPVDWEGDSDSDVADALTAEQAPAEIQQACDDMIQQANAQASSILAEAHEEAANIREKAADNGFKEGYDKGMAQAMREVEAKLAALDAEKERMAAEYEAALASVEPKMVEVITSVYAKVFSEGFYHNKDVMVALISKALRDSEAEDKVVIHVSADDYETLVAAKDELFAGAGFPVEPEIRQRDSLSAGQAKVETPYGIMDVSIDTELGELEKALIMLAHS